MEYPIIQEAADILKELTPENQAFFMTLLKVAEAAENGVKHALNQNQKTLEKQ